MSKIDELSISRDKAGLRVEDLQNKKTEMAIKMTNDPDSVSDEEITELSNSLAKARKARDLAQSALDEARANLGEVPENMRPVPVTKDTKETGKKIADRFIRDFKNIVTSGTDDKNGNGGLTIPVDIQTAIHELVRQQASLQNIVNVETVSTTSGSRVYEVLSDITPMAELDDEGAVIGDIDDPKLTLVKYAIHRYAGISTITNSLLKDTAANILAWIENWIAKKVTVTRNTKILEVMGNAPAKPTISNFDDIKDLTNNTLDPAIIATSSFITNQSGYNILSKMKDAEGRYLVQPDVTQPDRELINGKPVMVISDKWLPDIKGSHPLYYGDFKQAITLFDREDMSLMTTNVGGNAFETDTTKLRVIDRFDVQMIDDGAIATASFKTVADQTKGTADTGK